MDYVKEMYMEDVHSAALRGLEAITADLKERGIELSEEQGEEVYLAMDLALEKLSNGNYRHEM